MNNVESNISERRRFYLKRRNTIRRILLIFFAVVYTFLLYKIYTYTQYTKSNFIRIESYGNKFSNNELFQRELYSYLESRNFYFISPRELSKKLMEVLPIIENVAIRKYIFPDIKLVVSIKEKEVWGRVFYFASSKISSYLTSKGDIISSNCINIESLPKNLLNIYFEEGFAPTSLLLSNLKNFLDEILKRKLIQIVEIKINKNNEVEIKSQDGLIIKVGQLQNDFFIKLQRLETVMKLIKNGIICIEYLDLNYEGSAVIKPCLDKSKKKRVKLKIFKN